MPLMDEFKKERESMKDKPFKEKIGYFWYYYKWHTVGAVFFLIILITLVHDIVTSKEIVFNATFMNAYSLDMSGNTEGNAFLKEFAQLAGIDTEKYEVYLDTNMRFDLTSYDQASLAASQKFLAMSAAGEIDVVVSERDIFSNYADSGMFQDLRDCLTEAQLEKYADYFFYYDRTVLEREIDFEEVNNSDLTIPEDTVERRDPASMSDPVPVGIFLDDSLNDRLIDAGYFIEDQELVFGIMGKEENRQNCLLFLDWLTDKNYVAGE